MRLDSYGSFNSISDRNINMTEVATTNLSSTFSSSVANNDINSKTHLSENNQEQQ